MARTRTLRQQLVAWLAGPLLVLWFVSTYIDFDIAKRFVNLAYDRTRASSSGRSNGLVR